ncbi:accessory gene regulator B family protein [Eubacterium sp.]
MNISIFFINKLEKENLINQHYELYLYGLNNLFTFLLNIITLFIIALFINRVFMLIIFLISFMPLRSYSGGFHCHSQICCYFFSNIIISIILLLQPFILSHLLFVTILSIVFCLYIFHIKPYSNKIRRLNLDEITRFNKAKNYTLIFIIIFAFFSFFLIQNHLIYSTILCAIILVGILLLIDRFLLFKTLTSSDTTQHSHVQT